jgi:hypothetical protein
MTEALNDLYEQGFTCDFNLITNQSYGRTPHLPIQDFVITKTIRFEDNSDPAENSILYVIVSIEHRLKGTLVNAFGMYSDSLAHRFINSIHMQSPGQTRTFIVEQEF